MINIVVPMAGLGSRFADAGFKIAKPFIPVNGLPMIARVLKNMTVPNCRFILITRSDLKNEYSKELDELGKDFNIEVVCVDKLTEGATCTVLHSRELIQSDAPLLIANSDQLVDVDMKDMLVDIEKRNLDGSIMTFNDPTKNPKWSFAKIDGQGFVTEVKEKVAISEHATVGIYHFKHGSDFVDSSIDMICRNERVNNEFYVCPVYNYFIARGGKVGVFEIAQEAMHGLGTPEDLEIYLAKSKAA